MSQDAFNAPVTSKENHKTEIIDQTVKIWFTEYNLSLFSLKLDGAGFTVGTKIWFW